MSDEFVIFFSFVKCLLFKSSVALPFLKCVVFLLKFHQHQQVKFYLQICFFGACFCLTLRHLSESSWYFTRFLSWSLLLHAFITFVWAFQMQASMLKNQFHNISRHIQTSRKNKQNIRFGAAWIRWNVNIIYMHRDVHCAWNVLISMLV